MPAERSTTHPLQGRAQELADLTALIGLGGAARSCAVLLAGDAGVGKTRLLAELLDRTAGDGWRSMVGHCLDFGDSALPYLPFTELLGRLGNDAPELAEGLIREHPALTHLLPGRRLLSGVGTVDVENVERAELFESVHAAFEQLAASAPLLVILEDLHWADQSSRDLLSFLFARSFHSPVSIVASYRSDDLHRRHPLRAAAAQWGRTPGVHRMQLNPLPDRAVRDLVKALHPGPMIERDMQAIVARAEGNAFFAEELVVAAGTDRRSLPEDLADLLLVRLDQLDESAGQVVRAAACAGRRVSHELLARVVDLDGSTLEDALRAAVEHHVLVPMGSASYAFRHALLAEAVYDDLLPGERVRLHGAYVRALCGHDVDGTAAELARHARAAHDLSTAVAASIEAGDDAMSVGGPDEAARHYQLALELLGDKAIRSDLAEPVDVVALTAKAADAVLVAGHPHRALALVQEQLGQLPADAPAEDRARLLIASAMAALATDTGANALELSTEALGLVPAEPTVLRAKLLAVHARTNGDRQRDDEAVRWAAEARRLGEKLGLARVVADATTTLAKVEERAGNPEESKRVLEKIVAQARAEGDLDGELRALHHLGSLYFEAGELVEAGDIYTAATRRAAETTHPWAPFGLDARLMAGITAYVVGDWDRAAELVDVTGQSPPALAEVALGAVWLEVAAGRGKAEAVDLLPQLRPWWDKDGFVAILCGAAAIDLYGDAGDLDATLRVHDDVVHTVTALWQVETFLAQLRLAALTLGQLATHVTGIAAGARAALVRRADDLLASAADTAAQAERRSRPVGPEGRAWIQRGRAEHLRFRWLAGIGAPSEEELVSAWTETVAAFEAFGHVFEVARSRSRLAAVLRAAGRTNDSREVAQLARTTAQRLGAEPLLLELRRLGAAGPRATDSASRHGESLTPRELEILGLVAQGRSNSEIARQLFISAKTVSVHVSNILAKLGASGRTEAAALARQGGLLPG
ncbi:MAG TPA: AAA family ATPase [Nocardioidaceae bacterium]|nr:AAA family ATPase [Nocardioidaceae bacterium]